MIYCRILQQLQDIGVEGRKPSEGEQVSVQYFSIIEADDKMFDNSFSTNQSYQFPLGTGQVIRGWDEGIAILNKGAKATFFILASLANGESGSSYGIPGSADFIFYIELLE